MRRISVFLFVISVAILAMAASVAIAQTAGPPSGDGIQPTVLKGNQNCAALNPDYEELRVEPVADGTYTSADGLLTVTIDVRNTTQGQVFDWTSNIGVDAVIVKGGQDADAFVYDPPAEDKGDTNLHAPVNPSNGQFFGLSHISFCYDITPSIKVEKDGDDLSKVGDSVTYDFTITNDGDISLNMDSISDDKLGDLADDAPAACDSLDPGEFCTFSVGHTIPSGAADPYVNTVTVNYDGTLNSSTVSVSDTDTHSLNLFQPSVEVIKTGVSSAAVGQTIAYNFEINNTSSNDTPDLKLDSISDTVLGNLADDAPAACDSLDSGASCSFSANYTVQSGDPNPLVNVVTVHYHPDGFPNDITDTDDHSVTIVTPSIKVEKDGDDLSKVGDSVTYDFTITNDGDISLDLFSVSDDVLGDLADDAPAACDSLDPGEFCTFSVPYTVQSGAPDPLVNTVTVDYRTTLNGSTVSDSDTDTHSLNLFQPSVVVTKTGVSSAEVGDTITYNFKIDNTSSNDTPDLKLDSISDTVLGNLADDAPAACDSLDSGASCSFSANYTIQANDPNPLVNVVTVHYHPDGFPNDITDTDDHSVIVEAPFDGCTPGFWKNHTSVWDGKNGNDVTTTIQTTDLFNATFGVTSAQSGLSNSKTLLAAVKLDGGGKKALARHAAAALASADATGVDYQYTVEQVIALYRDAVGADPGPETVASAHAKLEAANEEGCPL